MKIDLTNRISSVLFVGTKGYGVENLWSIEDIKSKYVCTDEQAKEILDGVLNDEYICGEINYTINKECEYRGFDEVVEEL